MRLTTAVIIALVALPAHMPASARAAFLTFVSADGADTRPCSVQAQPCKTLARAISVTDPGGKIHILSTLPAQFVSVAKSLSIDGDDNSMIGTITINSGSAVVAIRNLNLTGRGSVARGVNIVSAAAVHIENCSIERYVEDGVRLGVNASTELYVVDSALRDNGQNGLRVDSAASENSISNSKFAGNAAHGIRALGGHVGVADSSISGNDLGISVEAAATVTMTRSEVAGNRIGIENSRRLMLDSCVVRGNSDTGISGGINSTMRMSNCVITNNAVGLLIDGTALSPGGNLITGNATNMLGTLLPLPQE